MIQILTFALTIFFLSVLFIHRLHPDDVLHAVHTSHVNSATVGGSAASICLLGHGVA